MRPTTSTPVIRADPGAASAARSLVLPGDHPVLVDDAPLLGTKLFAPQPRPEWVPRPRLEDRLAAGLRVKLTLLAAPAGFAAEARGILVASVSLDAGDNDPVRFWSYVAAAVDPLRPGVGRAALAGPAVIAAHPVAFEVAADGVLVMTIRGFAPAGG